MGARFQTWLKRPSTICLLHQVVDATGNNHIPATTRPSKSRCTSTSFAWSGKNIHNTKQRKILGIEPAEDEGFQDGGSIEPCLRTETPTEPARQDIFQARAFKALWMQANNTSNPRLAKPVRGGQEYGHGLKHWIELLDYRQRLDGFPGVADVWKSMRSRQVDLPTFGEDADVLWPLFINSSVQQGFEDKHQELLESVMAHAKDLYTRRGSLYPGLYKCLVGRWLRIKPVAAWPWHKIFVDHFGTGNVDLREVANDCIATTCNPMDVRRRFERLYKSTEQRNLYDHFIPKLLERVGFDTALRWHRLFIFNGDGPGQEVFALPKVQSLFELDGDSALPMVHNKNPQSTSTDNHAKAQFPPLTRATMSALVGDAHGIRQKEVGDNFVAKIFATQAFSLELVIKGLSFFAIEKLGPLAMREMALKAGNLKAFREGLVELRRVGVGIGDSVYGRLIQKVAQDGDSKLFDGLLASDQHPEAFDDYATQELLLKSFLDLEDMLNAHITLMSLSLAGRIQDSRGWNRLLQHYMRTGEYGAVAKTLNYMEASNMKVSRRTLTFMHRYLLPTRRTGVAPAQSAKDALVLMPLQFTTNAFIYAATHGTSVNPLLWIENLKRFAMLHKWDELERLVRWLVSWYKDRDRFTALRRGNRLVKQPSTLQTIFAPAMRKAIVTWGFRDASYHHQLRHNPVRRFTRRSGRRLSPDLPCDPWAKGIWLLKDLNDKGLRTSPSLIRDALKLRLWILFGPGFSTKAINEEARRLNELSLSHYVQHANEIWDGKLFNINSTLLENDEPRRRAGLLLAVFGVRARVNIKTEEYADVAAYAQAIASQYPLTVGRNVLVRRRIWQNSPFRLIRKVTTQNHSTEQPKQNTSTPITLIQRQQHLSRAVRSSNSRPPPNPQDTPEPSGPYSPLLG